MPISTNKLVNVKPDVIAATGNAIDLNGVILSDNDYLPIGASLPFSGADTALKKFGSASDEYAAASIYFRGVDKATLTPSKLYFSRFNREDSNAFLVGNNLNYNLAQLKALSGDITLSVNGSAQTASINLSEATSFLNAAVLIENALTGVTVDYNEQTKQYKITANGENAEDTAISHATGSLADELSLTSATGAYISIGSKATNAADFFTLLLDSTANWYSFTTLFEATDAEHLDFADWTNAQEHRYNYVAWTTSGTALTSGSQETILYKIEKEHDYADVTPVYCSDFKKPVNILGYYASLNFNQNSGRVALSYRTLSGLIVDVSTNANYQALTDNGYNFYGGYAANVDNYAIWQSGRITGKFMWADAHAGQAWLNANIQKTIVTALMGRSNIPYNNAGRALLSGSLVGLLEQFKQWGGCSVGTDLDDNQKQQITQLVGFDISSTLYAQGYYIYIGQFTSSMRANRTTPPCYVIYTDGGAFRTIELNSIEVQ